MTMLFDRHRPRLDRALRTLRRDARLLPLIVGRSPPTAAELDGLAGRRFALEDAGTEQWVVAPPSPYGLPLDVRYGRAPPVRHLAAMAHAAPAWCTASLSARAGIALEALTRLEAMSPLLARALVHTTGEPAAVAFERSVPLALARGLAAIAEAYELMRRRQVPSEGRAPVPTLIEAPAREPLGWALPELFAALVTGGAVLVRPHPCAMLPLALVVDVVRDLVREQPASPDVVRLDVGQAAIEVPGMRQVRSPPPAGAGNPVIVDSTDDVDGLCRQVADALLLCAGQRRERPQTLFVPEDGLMTDRGHWPVAGLERRLRLALRLLAGDPAHGLRRRGAVQAPETIDEVAACARLGTVVHQGAMAPLRGFPAARTMGPVVVATTHEASYTPLRRGSLLFLVTTTNTAESIERAAFGAATAGTASAVVFSTDDRVVETVADALHTSRTDVTCNPLAGGQGAWPDGFGDEGLPPVDERFVEKYLETP